MEQLPVASASSTTPPPPSSKGRDLSDDMTSPLISVGNKTHQKLPEDEEEEEEEGPNKGSKELYSLRWNDFTGNLLSSFADLKDSDLFTDVTIVTDHGHSFKCHKLILSACSPFFRQVLKENPCSHPIVILKDVGHQEMRNLLSFIYQGEVQISNDDLQGFLKTAQSLRVKGLTDCNKGNGGSPEGSDEENRKSPLRKQLRRKRATKRKRNQNRFKNADRYVEENPEEPSDMDMDLEDQEARGYSEDDLLMDNSMMQPEVRLTESRSSNSPHNLGDKSILVQALLQKTSRNGQRKAPEENEEDSNSLVMDEEYISSLENGGEAAAAAAALLGFHHQAVHQALPLALNTSQQQSSGEFQSNNSGNKLGRGHQSQINASNINQLMGDSRVRATDPRPCPKCGKIYRSAHTLRTHLEDKHTVCPGYRCVLCGTVAKSRNSLHSHMSRQHRGISTKDLPVLPMPSPFDPQLAARLLSKAGLKTSHSEGSGGGSEGTSPLPQGQSGSKKNHRTRKRSSHPEEDEEASDEDPSSTTTGSAILDTYLQFIAENSQAAVARLLAGQTLEQVQANAANYSTNAPAIKKPKVSNNNNKVLKSNNNIPTDSASTPPETDLPTSGEPKRITGERRKGLDAPEEVEEEKNA